MLRALSLSVSCLGSLVLASGCAAPKPVESPPVVEEIASPGPEESAPTAVPEEAPAPSVATNRVADPPPVELSSDLVIEQALESVTFAGKGKAILGASACKDRMRSVVLRIERPDVAARQAELLFVDCALEKKGKKWSTHLPEASEPLTFELRAHALDEKTTGVLVDVFAEEASEEARAEHWVQLFLSRADSLKDGWGRVTGRVSAEERRFMVTRPNGEVWETTHTLGPHRDDYTVYALALDPEGELKETLRPGALARVSAHANAGDATEAREALAKKCPSVERRLAVVDAPASAGRDEVWFGVVEPSEEDAKRAQAELRRCGITKTTIEALAID